MWKRGKTDDDEEVKDQLRSRNEAGEQMITAYGKICIRYGTKSAVAVAYGQAADHLSRYIEVLDAFRKGEAYSKWEDNVESIESDVKPCIIKFVQAASETLEVNRRPSLARRTAERQSASPSTATGMWSQVSSEATLVYTIALNGYAERYSEYVKSQREYAERNGYVYFAVTEPSRKYGASEASWLKIAVMNDALNAGYGRVAYIDCDAEILPSAPPLDNIFNMDSRRYVFMARGHSNRFNAGVMFIRNGCTSRRFFQQVWDAMGTPLDPADDVGWGENGHVIQV